MRGSSRGSSFLSASTAFTPPERHIFDLEAELNWLDHIESGAVSEAARRAAFAAAKGRSMNWAQAEAGISERAGVR